MNLINRIGILFSCNKIGIDEFGNSYYEKKSLSPNGKRNRYAIYNGIIESSKVPSEWHYWLHYTSDTPPTNVNTHKHSWQKIHLPNLIGTKYAYSPLANKNKLGSFYQAWSPENKIK